MKLCNNVQERDGSSSAQAVDPESRSALETLWYNRAPPMGFQEVSRQRLVLSLFVAIVGFSFRLSPMSAHGEGTPDSPA